MLREYCTLKNECDEAKQGGLEMREECFSAGDLGGVLRLKSGIKVDISFFYPALWILMPSSIQWWY